MTNNLNYYLMQVGTAGVMYMLTQLAKMMFLATFFPMPELEEEEVTPAIHHYQNVANLFNMYI